MQYTCHIPSSQPPGQLTNLSRHFLVRRIHTVAYWALLYYLFTWSLPAESHQNRSILPIVEGQLTLSSSLRVEQSGTLTFSCSSNSDMAIQGQLEFRLPRGIQVASSTTFDHLYLPPQGQQQYRVAIHVERAGHYPLQASLYFTMPDGQNSAAHFYLYLHTQPGQAQVSSYPLTARQQDQQLQVAGRVQQAVAGGISVGGTLTYDNDNLRQARPLVRAKVTLLQSDLPLGTTFSDLDGHYLFEEVILQPQVVNTLQLSIEMENDILVVTDPQREVYTFKSDLIRNVEPGHIQRDLLLDGGNANRGVGHIFETIQKAHNFLLEQVDAHRTQPISVIWPESMGGSYYHTTQFFGRINSESIHIAAGADQWRKNVMYHEYGHSLMSAVYNYDFHAIPHGEYREVHRLEMVTDPEFALSEGWAAFLEAAVDNRALNVTGFLDGRDPNLEDNQWWSGAHDGSGSNPDGSVVEGAVASILWDIFDTADAIDLSPSTDDDQIQNRFDLLWAILRDQRPKTVVQIAEAWRDEGYPHWEALQDIYATHHTLSQPNQAPTFAFTTPGRTDILAGPTYQIAWTVSDPEGDNYQIDLYYYPSNRNSIQAKPISRQVKGQSLVWETTNIDDGRYYLLAIATDSKGESVQVSSQAVVIIDQTPLQPPQVVSPTHPQVETGVANNSPIFHLSMLPTDPTAVDKSVYSYLLDRQPDTVPDTEADLQIVDHQLKLYGLEAGDWWLHVRAYDPLGYWSQTYHFAFTILPSANGAGPDAAVIDYLIELTLSESTEDRLKRWPSEIRLQPHGFPTNRDLGVLNDTVAALNALMETAQIRLTTDDPNFNIYFYPSIMLRLLESGYNIGNLGFISIRWQEDRITEGKALIDRFRTSQAQRDYLIRKQVAQGLGLILDSDTYPDSIFYQDWNSVAEFAPIDQQVVALLYHSQVQAGMTAQQLQQLRGDQQIVPIWQADIMVESLSHPLDSGQLIFGVSDEATDGFDLGIDQAISLPVAKPALSGYLVGNQAGVAELSADFRPAFETATYRLKVLTDGQGFRLKWSVSAIPADFSRVSIQIVSPQDSAVYDMRRQQQLAFEPGADQDYTFEITVGHYQTFTLDLAPGWNLVSIPGIPKTLEPAVIAADHPNLVLPFYSWDSTGYRYQPVTKLAVGQGYWVLSTDPAITQLEIPLTPVNSYQRHISPGWSLVGGLTQPIDFTDTASVADQPIGDSSGRSILRNSLYNWQPDLYTYDRSSRLEPGKGYWVLSLSDCQLTVTIDAVNTSSPSIALSSTSIPQLTAQLPLTLTTADQRIRLVVGWSKQAAHGLDAYDRVVPPTSPMNDRADAYLLRPDSGLRLQTDIQPCPDSPRWHLVTTREMDLTVETAQLPVDYKLSVQGKILTGEQQTYLAAGRVYLSLQQLPTITVLQQNYPNPFNPETWIPFDLADEVEVRLNIYSSEGVLVRQMNLGQKRAGSYQSRQQAIHWNGRNQNGESVTSGVYFYQIEAGDYRQIRKMVILR